MQTIVPPANGVHVVGKPMKSILLVLAAAALLALFGCFTAEKQLIADDKAVTPYEKISFRNQGSSDELTVMTREGKAYVAHKTDGDLTMRFLPLPKPDWYVVEMSGADETASIQRLYAFVRVDATAKLAHTYKSVADKDETADGMHACKDVLCIDDLDKYIAHVQAAIDAGSESDATYDISLE
jgi:hypothetical protein